MSPPAEAIWLVMSTMPDEATARRIAEELVERRLAACVNVMAPCRSVYRWQGAIDSATEVPLLAKVTAAGYPALESALRALHPYDLPEIIALPVATGLPGYLAWVATETARSPNVGENDDIMSPGGPR
jgi:periplasmic divalent cation tolerance protein